MTMTAMSVIWGYGNTEGRPRRLTNWPYKTLRSARPTRPRTTNLWREKKKKFKLWKNEQERSKKKKERKILEKLSTNCSLLRCLKCPYSVDDEVPSDCEHERDSLARHGLCGWDDLEHCSEHGHIEQCAHGANHEELEKRSRAGMKVQPEQVGKIYNVWRLLFCVVETMWVIQLIMTLFESLETPISRSLKTIGLSASLV